jgi:hypothetical protein
MPEAVCVTGARNGSPRCARQLISLYDGGPLRACTLDFRALDYRFADHERCPRTERREARLNARGAVRPSSPESS